jgi:3-oxoacyl-[acyl-carrier-protein] synthase III
MTHTRFESVGAYLPSTIQSTQELVAQMEYEPPFDLEALTGIRNRRVHDKRPEAFEDSLALAVRAAEDCLSRSRYAADQLDVIISASITRFAGRDRFYFEPSFALMVASALGAPAAIHFDVSNACAGMITGVIVLDRMIKAGVVRNGMVVSGERITTVAETAVKEIDQAYDPQFSSLTVGDSGAAVILDESVSPEDRIHYVELVTSARWSHLCVGQPSDRGRGIAMYTDNHTMQTEDRLRLWPTFHGDLLAKQGRTLADERFDYVIHHQVGTRFITKGNRVSASILGVQMPEPLITVDEYGNTSSTSHFVVLHDHLKRRRGRRQEKFLLVPAASGLVTGSLSATISSLEV